ncbi:MAG: hypothetical protein M1827_004943 [Pycnora praestabilis]|nr:MAG: hypothetical protein M1827_004943 [Pycnora praestabilis]
MPRKAAKKELSPVLSTDSSSLSSAPDVAELGVDKINIISTKSALAKGIDGSISLGANSPRKQATKRAAAGNTISAKRVKRTVKGIQPKYKEEVEDGEEPNEIPQVTPRKSRARRLKASGVKIETVEDLAEEEDTQVASTGTPKKTRKRPNAKLEAEEKDQPEEGETPRKAKKKRKTKEEKEAEAMPIAVRTTGLKMFIGAHVSAAKGVQNAVTNCVYIGGNAFALFLKSQRKWENPPLQEEHVTQFRSFCAEHKVDALNHILPHGSYLVNLAQKEPDKAKQAYDAFLDDLKRCESLGVRLYNFHPGNTGPSPRPEAISRIADHLNLAHQSTKTVKTLLENMAGKGNVIGSTFEDLRDIIALVEDKSRVGVCLDTCHAFVAGYDLRNPSSFKAVMTQFDDIVGMKYLSALHLNDSKAPFLSHRDLHQNIGLGFLGLRAFHSVMNETRFHNLPMVLETPITVKKTNEEGKEKEEDDKGIWAREIKLLESLIGMDIMGEEFATKEKELSLKGKDEREKYQEQYDRKQKKDRLAAEKGKGKGKRVSKLDADDDVESSALSSGESRSENDGVEAMVQGFRS